MQRGPAESTGPTRLLIPLEGEPFQEMPAHPGLWQLGGCHLLPKFHLHIEEVVLQEATEVEVCVGRTQGLQITRAWVSSCPGPWQLLWCPGHHPPPLGTTYACPGRRCSHRAALPLQEKRGASELLGLVAEEVAMPATATSLGWKIEAQREEV